MRNFLTLYYTSKIFLDPNQLYKIKLRNKDFNELCKRKKQQQNLNRLNIMRQSCLKSQQSLAKWNTEKWWNKKEEKQQISIFKTLILYESQDLAGFHQEWQQHLVDIELILLKVQLDQLFRMELRQLKVQEVHQVSLLLEEWITTLIKRKEQMKLRLWEQVVKPK